MRLHVRLFGTLACLLLLVATPSAQTPASLTQMSLAKSAQFLDRLQYSMAQVAVTVKAEALTLKCHDKRSVYADQVLADPLSKARQAAPTVVGGTNLIGTVVTNADPNKIDTSATDAAIFSQVSTFWNPLSGCDSGT